MKKKIKQSHNIYWIQYVVGPTHLHLLVLGPCQSQLVLWLIQDPLGSGVRKVVGRVQVWSKTHRRSHGLPTPEQQTIKDPESPFRCGTH